MSDRRYEPEYEQSPFAYKVKIAVADALATHERRPEELAKSLERHANAVRDEMGDPPATFTVEPSGNDRLPWVVYGPTGDEHLFKELGGATEFLESQLGGED